MTEVRNILLIGRTGNGKSTIGNVLLNRNNNFEEVFKESEYDTSQTEDKQIEEIEIEGVKYRIIDTVGIGDNRLGEEEVLYKIADAANSWKDGLSQIFFVTGGSRFTKVEIEVYDILRATIFDKNITKYTTIIRTKFANFRSSQKCEENEKKMIENKEISEIINSCNRIIHVDNPSLDIDDKDEKKINLEKRKESRKRLVSYLLTCQEVYKPKNLDGLNERIDSRINKVKELEKKLKELGGDNKELKEEIKKLKNEISQQTQGWFERAGSLLGEAVDNTVDAVAKIVTYPFKSCNIS